jgi:hypothetical protein
VLYLYKEDNELRKLINNVIKQILEENKVNIKDSFLIKKEIKQKEKDLRPYAALPFFAIDVFSIYINNKILEKKENILKKLLVYSLWIKFADYFVEESPKEAKLLLDFFRDEIGKKEIEKIKEKSITLYYFTIILNNFMTKKSKNYIRTLYWLNVKEMKTSNYLKYLDIKAKIGVYSFLVAYSLIEEELKELNLNNKKIFKLFVLFGALANLYDFLVDFKEEKKEKFAPVSYNNLEFVLLVSSLVLQEFYHICKANHFQ